MSSSVKLEDMTNFTRVDFSKTLFTAHFPFSSSFSQILEKLFQREKKMTYLKNTKGAIPDLQRELNSVFEVYYP